MCELKTKGFFLSFIPLHIKLYENIDKVEHLPWAVLTIWRGHGVPKDMQRQIFPSATDSVADSVHITLVILKNLTIITRL